LFTNDFNTVVGTNTAGFIQSLTNYLATRLNVSPSRIIGMTVSSGSIAVSFYLADTTNPNEASLDSASAALQTDVTQGTLTPTINGVQLAPDTVRSDRMFIICFFCSLRCCCEL
jgi:hypothetical protein